MWIGFTRNCDTGTYIAAGCAVDLQHLRTRTKRYARIRHLQEGIRGKSEINHHGQDSDVQVITLFAQAIWRVVICAGNEALQARNLERNRHYRSKNTDGTLLL
jgi:hypothetical protein